MIERQTYEEFDAIEQSLAGAEDLAVLRAAKKGHDSQSVPMDQILDELGLSG